MFSSSSFRWLRILLYSAHKSQWEKNYPISCLCFQSLPCSNFIPKLYNCSTKFKQKPEFNFQNWIWILSRENELTFRIWHLEAFSVQFLDVLRRYEQIQSLKNTYYGYFFGGICKFKNEKVNKKHESYFFSVLDVFMDFFFLSWCFGGSQNSHTQTG